MNLARAARLVETLAAAGVAECCICPGGRNSPLVVVLDASHGLTLHYGFEERSTAFFALGRARATARPVAVVTTSGTAAAELLPAAVEAHYSAVPLVLVTADRPARYRGTGAPQSIEQVGLFGGYAPTVYDGDGDGLKLAAWAGDHPIHINVSFDEPLVAGAPPRLELRPAPVPERTSAVDPSAVSAMLDRARRPLVIAGPLDVEDHPAVRRFLLALGAPVYAEALSGLREDSELAPLVFASGERALRLADYDAVLRIGGVPTVRFWRDLENRPDDVPVCVVSRAPFPGLTRATMVSGAPGQVFSGVTPNRVAPDATRPLQADKAVAKRLRALLAAEPRSEPGMIAALSALVPRDALVYLGNSLPVREWDLAAARMPRGWRMAANRGANGIDGQLSTFLGYCEPGREHWAVVGDLTALYDLAAPWLLRGIDPGIVRIVVVNNGGGQIFARLSPHAALRNEHRLGFEHWARMWSLPYHRWTEVPAQAPAGDRCVIELLPDTQATRRFWDAHAKLHSAT